LQASSKERERVCGVAGTYVFGLTSTAFIWSVARRRKTHELGWMPLFDTIALMSVVSNYWWRECVCDTARDDEVEGSTSSCKKYFHMPLGNHGPNLNLESPIAQKIISSLSCGGRMTGGQRGIHWGEQANYLMI
jgi:hypothetical protein